MRSKKSKESTISDRTFNIPINPYSKKNPRMSVRYNIESNSILFDIGVEDEPSVEVKDKDDGLPIRINEFSTDPNHKAIWLASLPKINEFREMEKLPPLQGRNAQYAQQEAPMHTADPVGTQIDPFGDEPEEHDETIPPPDPVMADYPGGATDQHPTLRPEPEYPASPTLDFIPVSNQTLVTNLKLVNNTLFDFLSKHIGEDDPDWKIIHGMMESCDSLYEDWEGDANAFVKKTRRG